MTPAPLFDLGLQPERTELAWRRTALAIATGSLVALRLLPELFGDLVWVVPGVVGVVFSAVVWFGARSRYRRFTGADGPSGAGMLPGGLQLLALTVFGVACGLGALYVALSTR